MKDLSTSLLHLPSGNQPIPFWSWNDELDTEELKKQIHWMKEQGIGGFFMHARGGLKTEYLSKEWFDAVKVCCEEALKLGMTPWIYDENGWPSGFAGGKLLEKEENRDMYIDNRFGPYDAAADVSYRITDNALIRITDDTSSNDQNDTFLNLYLKRSASTADILNPDVVRQFIDCTHEAYARELGEDFSHEVTGFFTDEPQYYRASTPYTPMIADYFKDTYQQDILDSLGLLFVEKQGYETFRYRYWLGMQTLMLQNFSKQIYDWCCKHEILFTGHYVEEPTLGGQMMCCAGVMPFYEYLHMPGIDWLGPVTKNEVSPRQLNSAAQQLGKKQTLTETFGCCGWNISPANLKRIAGFQFVCGVNMMCHHLLPYSEHGQRKKDYPAHFNPANPWINEHFKDFNDYFSRLGYLLSESTESVYVAMLHPLRSAYLTYKRGNEPYAIPESELDAPLQEACRTLSARGISYHFLDETLLEKYGFAENGKIGCGKCTYDYLVIPKLYTMSAHTAKLIESYLASGGKVLLFDQKPTYMEGTPHEYEFLNSNCTLSDIMAAQPFSVDVTDTELYYTYRQQDDCAFLFIQNASAKTGYTQTFRFSDDTQSFDLLDLNTLEVRSVPLTVSLGKNESILLFPSKEPVKKMRDITTLSLDFKDAHINFEKNHLTLDMVRYSTDGVSYSEPLLCNELCSQLLTKRYEGQIFLRYEFCIKTLPEDLYLYAEKDSSAAHFINGTPITFNRDLREDISVSMCPISAYVHTGINHYDVQMHWHQSESTYYALFGEGVTESLKNCIAYDSEIEPVYLSGQFGVYSDETYVSHGSDYLLGSDFYIDVPPTQIMEPVTDGLPFFRGHFTLTKNFDLDTTDVKISIPGRYLSAKVYVNGTFAGELLFENTLDISAYTQMGENTIQAIFTIGNRNLLGPFHSKEEELFVSPDSFHKNDFIDETSGKVRYKFQKFYK